MKTTISLVLASVLASSLVCADNLTEKKTDKAKIAVVTAPIRQESGVTVIVSPHDSKARDASDYSSMPSS